MAIAKHLVLAFSLGCLLQNACSTYVENGSGLFDILLARIESLEANDVANKAKIAELESELKTKLSAQEREISDLKLKMEEMESTFEQKESAMLDQLNELKSSSEDVDLQSDNGDRDLPPFGSARKQRRDSKFRKYREAPDTEVAFYATHKDYANHHLGQNQILPFSLALTNIGHGLNTNTGAFTAPVDGTYVIHATIMGLDTPSASHMRAHFDVDGTAYSVFWVTALDQSSQMLVIDLVAGQTVTIRSDYSETGYVGTHHSSFSGFLLYQHFPPTTVVGK